MLVHRSTPLPRPAPPRLGPPCHSWLVGLARYLPPVQPASFLLPCPALPALGALVARLAAGN